MNYISPIWRCFSIEIFLRVWKNKLYVEKYLLKNPGEIERNSCQNILYGQIFNKRKIEKNCWAYKEILKLCSKKQPV